MYPHIRTGLTRHKNRSQYYVFQKLENFFVGLRRGPELLTTTDAETAPETQCRQINAAIRAKNAVFQITNEIYNNYRTGWWSK